MVIENEQTSGVLRVIGRFFKRQFQRIREQAAARAASPHISGINFIDEAEYKPAKLSKHPAAGSHEHIEPMK